ncbi:hypothetical protein ACFLZY_00620 [Patescibacteria group bacterium]
MLPTITELLSQSLTLYKKQKTITTGYISWLLIPFAGFLFLDSLHDQIDNSVSFGLSFIATLIQIIIWLTVFIILTRLADQEHKKNLTPETLTANLFPAVSVVLVVTVLKSLITIGGLLVLIIPGVIFLIWYHFAETATVLNNQKGMAALTYSHNLIKKRFWLAAWKIIAGPLAIFSGYIIILAGLLSLIGFIGGIDQSLIFRDTPPLWVNAVSGVAEIFTLPLFIFYSTFLYKSLRKTSSYV